MITAGRVIGEKAKVYSEERDQYRLERLAQRSLEATKKARTKHRSIQMAQNQFYEEEERLLYGPGIAE